MSGVFEFAYVRTSHHGLAIVSPSKGRLRRLHLALAALGAAVAVLAFLFVALAAGLALARPLNETCNMR